MTCSTYSDATPRARRSGRRPTRKAIRRGLSLLEVLIAMGVLLIGLLGVGAMITAGRIEIIQGVKLDYASMVGRSAFRDLKARGFLNPTNWNTLNGGANFPMWDTTIPRSPSGPFFIPGLVGNQPRVAVVFDPLGITSPTPSTGFTATFPTGAGLSLVRTSPLGVIDTSANNQTRLAADIVFRCADDLILTPNAASGDLPPAQLIMSTVKRASEGNYSWIATVVPEPTTTLAATSLDAKVIVSVAVLYKRALSTSGAGESTTKVSFPGISYTTTTFTPPAPAPPVPYTTPYWGTEVTLTAPVRPAKPGQWIMLAGTMTQTPGTVNGLSQPLQPPGTALSYFRWYRVLAADAVAPDGSQSITLYGSDWPVLPPKDNAGVNTTVAWIIDNVIAVYEKNMRLELPDQY